MANDGFDVKGYIIYFLILGGLSSLGLLGNLGFVILLILSPILIVFFMMGGSGGRRRDYGLDTDDV